jgi:D-xylose 1-dehydrogenase (NADP+, D-xylono-1,5-lactone-forming)
VGLSLGLLSTAKINAAVVAGARQTAAVDVVAVASRDLARSQAHAAEHGIPRAYGSYKELLDDAGVGAVYIALPNSLHVEWAIKALEAGKHVLCEKPLTRHPEEAARAFEAAERAGRTLIEAFMWRYTPQTSMLLELLPRVGELRMIRAHFSFPEVAPGNVRLSSELEGGALMDVGCYCVSGIRLVAGAEPESFTAQRRLGPGGVDLAFTGTMRFASGVLAHFDCAMDSAFRHELEVVGSEHRLLLRDPWRARSPGIELDGEVLVADYADPYTCELEALATGDERFGRADAVAQAQALAALHAAAGG